MEKLGPKVATIEGTADRIGVEVVAGTCTGAGVVMVMDSARVGAGAQVGTGARTQVAGVKVGAGAGAEVGLGTEVRAYK